MTDISKLGMDNFPLVRLLDGKIWDDRRYVDCPAHFDTEIMEHSNTLTMLIDFPVAKERIIEVVHDDGTPWTLRQFIDAVVKMYADIYADKAETFGYIPKSHSPASIPYTLEDLVMEAAGKEEGGNVWWLWVS